MQKESFVEILERQQASGLTIKDFCRDEAYTESSFYYWKSKFGFSRSYHHHSHEERADFSPIRFSSEKNSVDERAMDEVSAATSSEISIELPNGVNIRFKGMSESKLALGFISQICSCDVLSK